MKQNGIAYDQAGDGEPLLLLHGTGGSRRHWRPVIKGLAAHYDVIAADLPGHGESTRRRPTATTAPSATPPRWRSSSTTSA